MVFRPGTLPQGVLISIAEVYLFFFYQAEDGIRDWSVTGVQTCALPIFKTPSCCRPLGRLQATWCADSAAEDGGRRRFCLGVLPQTSCRNCKGKDGRSRSGSCNRNL